MEDTQSTGSPPAYYSDIIPGRGASATSLHDDSEAERTTGTTSRPSMSLKRKPIPALGSEPEARIQGGPVSPVRISHPEFSPQMQASSARIESNGSLLSQDNSRPVSGETNSAFSDEEGDLVQRFQNTSIPGVYRPENSTRPYPPPHSRSQDYPTAPPPVPPHQGRSSSAGPGLRQAESEEQNPYPPLQYHHQPFIDTTPHGAAEKTSRASVISANSNRSQTSQGDTGRGSTQYLAPNRRSTPGLSVPRPESAYSLGPESMRDRSRSPQLSPNSYARDHSAHSRSPHSPNLRPLSYVDLLNVPYPQPAPAPANLDNAHLRTSVGNNASLLSTRKTLEMYRANVKKTNDPAIQYEFAIFMINAAQEAAAGGLSDDGTPDRGLTPSPRQGLDSTGGNSSSELLREARSILQKLSDRSYPFAQYYLADGYASGLFNKGTEDYDKAFPLFLSASKHGHAEASYRTALCYEFGWGCRKDAAKAVQFYRQSASKNHPGAMSRLGRACIHGDMGLGNRYREGIKWMKRASESADFQYNSAPFELGLMHEAGFGNDIFQDESYAAQLYTQAADLGHAEAAFKLGEAYEHGKLNCPKDPALSVHFYTCAAQKGHALAMMALCAWYTVGAEPVLEKDDNEAYEWARRAAECGKWTTLTVNF